jgi:hypothetical protein
VLTLFFSSACPENFVGIRCEHSIEICEAGQHVCFHGSKCVRFGEETGCDCSTASKSFAGASCQHAATDMCTVGAVGLGQSRFFCVNNGLCKAYVSSSENDPGCNCVDDWTGPHCELMTSAVAGFKETPVNAVTPTATPPPSARLSHLLSMRRVPRSLLFLLTAQSLRLPTIVMGEAFSSS